MILCMCSHPRSDHHGGDGECGCGCPLWRPVRVYSILDNAHDEVFNRGVAEQLRAEHALVPSVTPLEDGAAMWIETAPLPDCETCGNAPAAGHWCPECGRVGEMEGMDG